MSRLPSATRKIVKMSFQQDAQNAAYLKAQLVQRTAPLPENVRQLLLNQEPSEALAWLDQNSNGDAFIALEQARATPAGRLTDEQRAFAAKVGMTPEQYAQAAERAGVLRD